MSESVEFQSCHDSSQLKPFQSDIILDALLGTGVKGNLRQPILEAVRVINRSKGYKISIDLPSGLDTDTGEPHGEAVRADMTLSLHRTKVGVAKNPDLAGEIVVLPIGIPPEAETFAGPGDFKTIWKPRSPDAHKGDSGRLLIIGGSELFTGAPAYAALAATKLGTDLVYVASPSKTAETISNYSPDLITIKLPGDHLTLKALEPVEPFIKMADALVIGPGIGLHEETHEAVWRIVSEVEAHSKPAVIDADALKILGRKKRRLKTRAVLTPHAGEFALLAQRKIDADMDLKKEAAKQLSRETGATVVLKGRIDIIAEEYRVRLNRTGNPHMTVGGTGDVLTGIIGGLLAQHVDPFEASVVSTFLNGLAGDLLLLETGTVTASTLVDYVPKAMKYCIEGPPYPSSRK
jgi:NAD(P)H-hydrate epimerase